MFSSSYRMDEFVAYHNSTWTVDNLTNDTGNAYSTNIFPSLESKPLSKVILQCFIIAIGVVGTLANGFVMFSMLRQKSTNKSINALIINQLALDMFASVSLVVIYSWDLMDLKLSGTLNRIVCLVIGDEDFIWIGVNGSYFNLTSITVERYLKIVFLTSYKKFYRDWVTYLFIVLAWVYGFLWNFPALYFTTDYSDGNCIGFAIWPSALAGNAFGWSVITAFYFIPLAIFTYCYVHIFYTIRRSGNFFKNSESGGVNTSQSNQQQKSEYSLIKTVVIINVVFTIFWAPLNVAFILAESGCCGVDTSGVAWQTGVFFGYVTLCLDPFIYASRLDVVKKFIGNCFGKKVVERPKVNMQNK